MVPVRRSDRIEGDLNGRRNHHDRGYPQGTDPERGLQMIVNAGIVSAAKKHGRTARNLWVPSGGKPINKDQVVDLLAKRTSPGAQSAARDLLQNMAEDEWTVTAAAHEGGFGGDATPHVTVLIGRRQYHLRIDHSEFVFDITYRDAQGAQRLSGRLPWVPPGAIGHDDRGGRTRP
jgi:hypothetical protein